MSSILNYSAGHVYHVCIVVMPIISQRPGLIFGGRTMFVLIDGILGFSKRHHDFRREIFLSTCLKHISILVHTLIRRQETTWRSPRLSLDSSQIYVPTAAAVLETGWCEVTTEIWLLQQPSAFPPSQLPATTGNRADMLHRLLLPNTTSELAAMKLIHFLFQTTLPVCKIGL